MVITDIKNCKISVENKYHFNSILFAAKLLGYKENCKGLGHTNAGNLFFHNDMRVGFTSDYDWFCDHEYEEIWFYNGEFHDKPQDDVEWKNGDIAFAEFSSHDEIKFIGLSSNKAVAICECITDEKKVILDKFWVSDLLKEKPLTKEEIEKQERLEAAYHLYYLANSKVGNKVQTYEGWVESSKCCDFWLSIIEETGYRKGEL